METTIKFKNLSGCLKTAIVISWVSGILLALAFLIGLMGGLMGG